MINSDAPVEDRIKTRPKVLTMLAILVFAFSLFQLFSFSQIILHWDILADLPLTSKPILLAGYRVIWSFSGFLFAFGLWKGKSWARIGSMAYWTLFSICSWIRLIWIVESTVLHSRWPVNMFVTVIGLGALIAILSLKSTRSFFERNPVKIP